MDLQSIMRNDLATLQQTVQMSLLNRVMTAEADMAQNLLRDMPAPDAPHPTKGAAVDLHA